MFSPPNIEYDNISPSTSYVDKSIINDSSSLVVKSPIDDNTGASFIALTVTVKPCEADRLPSLTVTINDSLP